MSQLQVCILGLSITSSWGNGHATTFRSLVKGLVRQGHSVVFLERNVPWYAESRDLPEPPFGKTYLYSDLDELYSSHQDVVQNADLVIVGSYVPDGVAVGDWVQRTCHGVTAFYDIDTPVTLSKLRGRTCEYLEAEQIRDYDLYLSFTSGSTLKILENEYGAPLACPLYCSVDPDAYFPMDLAPDIDLGYLGTYSTDRQPKLTQLMLEPAAQWEHGRFIVAGAQYPQTIAWPPNVERVEHLPPHEHAEFYNRQRYTLNVTRADMVQSGYSPSVRLFEAAACGTPIISDWWPGLDSFFQAGQEILIAHAAEDVLRILREIPEEARLSIAQNARRVVLEQHTSEQRAIQLEQFFEQAFSLKHSNADSGLRAVDMARRRVVDQGIELNT